MLRSACERLQEILHEHSELISHAQELATTIGYLKKVSYVQLFLAELRSYRQDLNVLKMRGSKIHPFQTLCLVFSCCFTTFSPFLLSGDFDRHRDYLIIAATDLNSALNTLARNLVGWGEAATRIHLAPVLRVNQQVDHYAYQQEQLVKQLTQLLNYQKSEVDRRVGVSLTDKSVYLPSSVQSCCHR